MALNDQNRPNAVFTPKDEIALRIDENVRREENLRRQRRLRRTILILVALILASGIVTVIIRLRRKPVAPIWSVRNGPVFGKGTESVFNYGKLWENEITLPDRGRFAIQIYDFDVYYYTQGRDRVADEAQFVAVLTKHQDTFAKSWVVVLAGASFEGDQRRNLELCRRRVTNVAKTMHQQPNLRGLGYWIIPLGEFRLKDGPLANFGEDSAEVEAQEEEESKKLGDDGLKAQRRLIVVAVRPVSQTGPESAQSDLDEIFEALDENGTLPSNYDFGKAKPARLDVQVAQ